MLVLILCGVAAGYLGYWSPRALLTRDGGEAASPARDSVILEFPALDITLPDLRPRRLHLAIALDVPRGESKRVEAQIPRMRDSFIVFLTGIAPAAFERRGILDVVRDEMSTRARLALDDEVPVEVLIQEFVLK